MTTIDLVRNDTKFDLEMTLKDSNGHAVDLTGYSAIKFKMALPDATTCKINGSCTVVQATTGEIKYSFQDGDLDTDGTYDAEVEVTYTNGKILTATGLTINVVEDLPAT